MLEEIESRLNILIANLGQGRCEPVAQDTAWIARVPNFPNINEPAFPQALIWLRKHQCADGKWGTKQPLNAHGSTIETLSAVIALQQWGQKEDEVRIQHGLQALERLAFQLEAESYETTGFELLLPTLVKEAAAM